jgi:hypothetical protein
MWQDYVIGIVGFGFSFMLIPQIIASMKGNHVNRATSLMTSIGLLTMSIVMITLDLWISAIANFCSATVWGSLFVISTFKNKLTYQS